MGCEELNPVGIDLAGEASLSGLASIVRYQKPKTEGEREREQTKPTGENQIKATARERFTSFSLSHRSMGFGEWGRRREVVGRELEKPLFSL